MQTTMSFSMASGLVVIPPASTKHQFRSNSMLMRKVGVEGKKQPSVVPKMLISFYNKGKLKTHSKYSSNGQASTKCGSFITPEGDAKMLPDIRASQNLSRDEEVELKVTPERRPPSRYGKDVLIRKV